MLSNTVFKTNIKFGLNAAYSTLFSFEYFLSRVFSKTAARWVFNFSFWEGVATDSKYLKVTRNALKL